jgi:ubiquinol-cytochrome c reductase cytochrome b subunit
MKLKNFIAWFTQASFVISMLSGLVVAFAYHPTDAYQSLQKINYIIPFGSLFRELHYFSSEIFLVSLFIHVVVELANKNMKITFSSWIYSIVALFAVVVLMFTGFVLKGDQSANAAAQVAFSLLLDTPFLDIFLPLFKDSVLVYWKFYIWHILFLPILLTYAIYRHVKKISSAIDYFVIALGLTMIFSIFVPMPKDIPLESVVDKIEGPWFFWGAENLLQMGVSAPIVNMVLIFPFILLVSIYFWNKITIKNLLLIWFIVYAYLSI